MKTDAPPLTATRAVSRWFARRIAAAVVLAITVFMAMHVNTAYQTAVTNAEERVTALAMAVEQSIGRDIRNIDSLLGDVVNEVQDGNHTSPRFQDAMLSRLKAFPEIRYVGVVSADGRLLPGTWPAIPIAPGGLDVHDRAYFTRQSNGPPSTSLVVGDPVVGRSTGERTIHVSRPIVGHDGRFQGVVIAAINPDIYARYLSSVLVDDQGASGLYRTDGVVLARAPDHTRTFGRDISGSDLFTVWMPRAPVGVAHLIARADGNAKLLAYRVLPGYPLMISSGISRRRALDEWSRMVAVELVLVVAFAMALAVVGWQVDLRMQDMQRRQELLETAIADRTAAYVDARDLAVVRASRLASLNDELKRLAVITAHHLQEPVRLIVSYTQLLSRQGHRRSPEEADSLDFVLTGGLRLKALLRDFERYVTVLTHPLKLSPANLGDIAGEAAERLATAHGPGTIEVHIGACPTLGVDLGLLPEVFHQVFENSIAHRNHGQCAQIIVLAEQLDHEWVISVSDNGPGIPPEIASQLLQVFENVGNRDPDSTGLGLPISRVIVQAHGGKLWIEPSETGTTVCFSLPKEPVSQSLMESPSDIMV
jgi:signal transduction histidine kinase